MHDLVGRTIEKFLNEDPALPRIEPGMLPPGAMLREAASRQGKPVHELVEDLGAWLVRQNDIWRLLRFCGQDFLDFLLRLDELPERIRLITDDLHIPEIRLSQTTDGLIWITLSNGPSAWDALLSGLLRAMADDYGALCVITRVDEGICIDVPDSSFSAARKFRLSATAVTG